MEVDNLSKSSVSMVGLEGQVAGETKPRGHGIEVKRRRAAWLVSATAQ